MLEWANKWLLEALTRLPHHSNLLQFGTTIKRDVLTEFCLVLGQCCDHIWIGFFTSLWNPSIEIELGGKKTSIRSRFYSEGLCIF